MSDSAVREVRASIARVFSNRDLRRVQLAFLGSNVGGWAYATALTVWAYQEGGAAAVGIFQAVRFIASAIAGPFGAVIADKVSRKALMVGSDAINVVLVSLAAVAITADWPPLVVYLLGVLVAIVTAPFRSAQAGLMPHLARDPEELTSSNAVASNIENLSSFLGPALGAALVGVTDVQTVFWLNVGAFLWSLLMVSGVRVRQSSAAVTVLDHDGAEGNEEAEGFLGSVVAGFRAVGRDRDLRVVSMLAIAQGFIWGALTVFMVLMAIEMLETGAHGVGYLNAVLGVSTVVGGVIVLARAAKGRIGQDMAIGVLGWAAPLLLLAAFPSPVTAVAALAIIGVMDPWVNLGLDTIPQRLAPDTVLSRAFAAIDAGLIGAMSLGAFAAPLLIDLLGFRWSLALIGAVIGVYAVSRLGQMRALDSRLTAPPELPLLRSVAIFTPLPDPTIEMLARKLERVTVPAGRTILREGEGSDQFFVIAAGEVEVTQGGEFLRRELAGDFFGEIGLLRDVPRTATITAVTETELLSLQRSDFLEAVTGARDARLAAEDVVSRRLGV